MITEHVKTRTGHELIAGHIKTWTGHDYIIRAMKFGITGVVGVAVNTVVLYVLVRWARIPLVAASVLAVELAVVSNYLMNDRWTFAVRAFSLRRFAKFNISSLAGLAVNVLMVLSLVKLGMYFVAANLAGIAVSAVINFALCVTWVWR